MDQRMKVVGLFRGIAKDGKSNYTIVHLVGDFEDYQEDNSVGNVAENHYIRGYVEVSLGDEVEKIYGVGFGGKAVVKSLRKLVD